MILVSHIGSRHTSVNRSRRSSIEVLVLADVLPRQNRKEYTKPEVFSFHSVKSVDRFFDRFEKYCMSKYAVGTNEQWTGELGHFLGDDLLQVFRANGGGDRNYSDMKMKIRKY